MLKYKPEKPILSWFRLISCLSIVCAGTAGAIYLCWRIHWVAGVVISYPVSILLGDVLIEREKSFSWYFCDFIRYILVFGGTVLAVRFLWKIDWRLGAIAAIPIFILLVFLFGLLTAPVYYFTSESWAARKKYDESLKKEDAFLKDIEKRVSDQREEHENTSVTGLDQKTP